MADAGKVAILPRGLWSAETVYEPLDLVYYNNNSFVALKESVGVTPVDGNTWMLSVSSIGQETINAIINGTQRVGDSAKLGGKVASEYALSTAVTELQGTTALFTSILEKALEVDVGIHAYTLGGDNYTGADLPASIWKYGMAVIYKRNKNCISVDLHCEGSNRAMKNAYKSGVWSGWGEGAITTDLANYLPLSGGNVDGLVKFLYGGVGEMYMFTHSIGGRLRYDNKQGIADLILTNENLKYMRDKNGVTSTYELLHTGNKPTGSYTGNGDATTRTIDTKGLGSVVAITVTGSTVIVLYGGAIIISNGTVSGLSASEANFRNGVLTLATTNGSLNTSGTTYYWQVL